jgi:hypothetical protein
MANFNQTPNPSKAPWYFLGLQELLTMFLMFWAVLVIIGSFFRGEGFNFILPWRQGVHEIFDL